MIATQTLQYHNALALAMEMMSEWGQLEPTSALKEAGRACGIAYGDEMEAFVRWAMQTAN